MRSFFVVMALAACAPHATSGPAWPKTSTAETDGGESLAPHESHQIVVSEKVDDDAKPAVPVVAPPPAPTVDVAAPVVAPPVTQPVEETTTTEDIIIEVDD